MNEHLFISGSVAHNTDSQTHRQTEQTEFTQPTEHD